MRHLSEMVGAIILFGKDGNGSIVKQIDIKFCVSSKGQETPDIRLLNKKAYGSSKSSAAGKPVNQPERRLFPPQISENTAPLMISTAPMI